MATITNKDDFLSYCLRQLGAPVINIEVTDEQLDDAYSDAIRKLQDFHMNGVERQYLKYQLTDDDILEGTVPLPDSITGVARVLNIASNTVGGQYIFDLNYQIRMNDLWDLQSSSLPYYTAVRQYTNMLDQMFNGQPMFRFNRVQQKVYLDINKNKLKAGMWVVMEVFRALTPEEFPELFMEPWLKKYTTALIKKQWGSNLKKFNNVVTIGNVAVDGQNIFNEAIQEISELDEVLRNTYEEPVAMLVG